MRRGTGSNRRWWVLVLTCAVLSLSQAQQQPQEEPQDVGLREEAERQLVQLDASVSGPAEAIQGLVKGDFVLFVNTKRVEDFIVDNLCTEPTPRVTAASEAVATEPEEAAPTQTTPAQASPPVVPTAPPVTYMFYFDHAFMSLEGRNLAPEIARELITDLVHDGNRALIVSSGAKVKTYSDMTGDHDVLLEALDTMYNDRDSWWDPTQRPEESRIQEVLEALNTRTVDEAAGVARMHQAEERWRAEKAMRRFSMVLGRMAEVPQPKAVLYFADRLRSNPGEHFVSYFNQRQIQRNASLRNALSDADWGALSYQNIVNEANAHGARLYTVQAEGMTGLGSITYRNTSSVVTAGTRHITDAQNTLVSLAAETGGEAFLRGVKSTKIAARIKDDLSCMYLLSFDAARLPRNEAVAVKLTSDRAGVTVKARGQIFIQSHAARQTSRLLSAFTAPDAISGGGRVRGRLVPVGFEDGEFKAMLQVQVAGSPLSGVTWDVGASVLFRDKVREDDSGRVSISGAGTPVVFESVMSFPPGPYEIAMVAHETSSDEVLTGKLEGEWPDPDDEQASVGPIAVMQPAAAVFLRDGATKSRGALELNESSPLSPDQPTAILSIVCWSKSTKGVLEIQRSLVGESSVSFPPLQLQADDAQCAPLQDLVPANTMTEGSFKYEVRVMQKDVELATGNRAFDAGPDATASNRG